MTNSMQKGNAEERRVANLLTQATALPWQRNLEEVRTHHSQAGGDVVPAAGYTSRLCVQVKHMVRPRPIRAYEEALAAATDKQMAVAFVKRTQVPGIKGHELVVMSQDDFLTLIERAGVR